MSHVRRITQRAVAGLLEPPQTRASIYAPYILVVVLAVLLFARVHGDEKHTRAVQTKGVAAQHCLAQVMIGVKPLIASFPQVIQPLEGYLQLEAEQPMTGTKASGGCRAAH